MSRIYKIISIVLILVITFTYTAFADNKTENNPITPASVEVDIKDSDVASEIIDKLETILDPDNNELEKEVTEILVKHSENRLVRFFRTIIDAIRGFLDSVFKLASEAAKIGVD